MLGFYVKMYIYVILEQKFNFLHIESRADIFMESNLFRHYMDEVAILHKDMITSCKIVVNAA